MNRAEKAAHIRRLLDTEGEAIEANTRTLNEGRYEAMAELGEYEELRTRARETKEDAIERLPELVEQVTEAIEARGGEVYLADDAADANAYIREVAREHGAETAVKSKSMTTEEIDVNDALAAGGVDVWETDLGEFVIQLADEAPSHFVGPALHKSRAEIADLFNARFDPDPPLETAEELTRFAREFLVEKFEEADLGLTGANFVAADTGTLALVTSEGNARKTVAATDTHVAVAGVEKLIPAFDDLAPFVELIGRSGTGQDLTSYLSFLTPPGDADPGPDDRAFHLVLLDNGRFEMREDEDLRETLYCIRCGACANSCANFQQVGGHAFGGETYSGGIGTGWEAGVHGLDSAAEFNDLCTGCSRCVNNCPVKIDIPWINTVVRDRINRGEAGDHGWLVDGLRPDDAGGFDPAKTLFANVETVARVASATAPVSNWVAGSRPARALLDRVAGVDSRRALPTFQRETLVDWFAARGPRVEAVDADREAVLYPDVYTNYADTARGKAAVRVLESLGVRVRVPDAPESGRAPLSQGKIAAAESAAAATRDALAPHVEAGRDVVVVEPSDLAMFRREYDRLLDGNPLAEAYEVTEYVHGLLANGADAAALRAGGDDLALHAHCQARTLGLEGHAAAVLERVGHDVTTTDAECCGMAGSFGYKSEYYELSQAVGESLVEELDGRPVATGTSCCEQIGALTGREVPHPVELLDPDAV